MVGPSETPHPLPALISKGFFFCCICDLYIIYRANYKLFNVYSHRCVSDFIESGHEASSYYTVTIILFLDSYLKRHWMVRTESFLLR
jgi:hypothetical protein